MRAPTKRSPWRRDFSSVAPESRRAGRYALQLVDGSPEVLRRLQDTDFLGALWVQCVPLIDPTVLAQLYAEWRPSDASEDEEDDDFELDDLPDFLKRHGRDHLRGFSGRLVRNYLHGLLGRIPRTVLRRLAEQDGNLPTHPSVALIAQCAGLDSVETMILDLVEKRMQAPHFGDFLRETNCNGLRNNYNFLASALAVSPAQIKQSLSRSSALRSLGLLSPPRARDDLEDFVRVDDLLAEILTLAPETPADLLAIIVEPVPPSPWKLDDFPHLQTDGARLQKVLSSAVADHAPGINALLYGPPGTGKTEFAQAVARAAGLATYRVKTADDEGDGLSRQGRLGAYQLLQRLLRGRSDCVVIFDEVEDAFGNGGQDVLRALFGGRPSSSQGDKGWMNRVLEENPIPAVWITNDADSMDQAFLRRFLLPVAFTTPPRAVRRKMIDRHLGDKALPEHFLDELAADDLLAPAQFGAARRLLDLQPDSDPVDAVRGGLSATRRLLHGSASPRQRHSATRFDPAFLNLAGGIAPGRITEALRRSGHGRLCFYGPPGTGKTEFAHVLADALDRELVVKTSSDLVSKYVGETERNLAALFNTFDAERCVLFLDEVDSLLRDRRQAQHSWETTQVNELLQQIERFPGIFIAATNLMDGLDTAALRRFDFKLHFRPLTPTQRLALFAREALGSEDEVDAIPPLLARKLHSLDLLTPGDFSNVARQGTMLGETLAPEDFLRRLIAECRWKDNAAKSSVAA